MRFGRVRTDACEEKSAPAPSPKPQLQSSQFSLPPVDLKSLPRNIFLDQKNFWSTPFRMTDAELQWTVPLAFAGAALVASDTAIETHVPTNPTTVSRAVTFSQCRTGAMAGIGGGMFVLGHFANNDQERETGLLSGEAGIDAFLDTEVFKYAFGRERPFTGSGKGHFFQGGTSFLRSTRRQLGDCQCDRSRISRPSDTGAGLRRGGSRKRCPRCGASALRFRRDSGQRLGWYIGRQTFRSHSHYSDAEIAKWGTFSKGDEIPPTTRGTWDRRMCRWIAGSTPLWIV